MSEVVTITGGATAIIYGTLDDAKAYVATKYGPTYAAWRALGADDDDRKMTLATAAAYIDQQVWTSDYDTFAERDALEAFQFASYELAVMILTKPSLVSKADQGSNIQSVQASGAGVTYFNPTTSQRGSAPILPPIIMRLVGQYLSTSTSGIGAPRGQSGSSSNPFATCPELDRGEPY